MTIFRFSILSFSFMGLIACQQSSGEDAARIQDLEERVWQLEQTQASPPIASTASRFDDKRPEVSFEYDAMSELRSRAETSRLEAEQARLRSEIADMKRDEALREVLGQ